MVVCKSSCPSHEHVFHSFRCFHALFRGICFNCRQMWVFYDRNRTSLGHMTRIFCKNVDRIRTYEIKKKMGVQSTCHRHSCSGMKGRSKTCMSNCHRSQLKDNLTLYRTYLIFMSLFSSRNILNIFSKKKEID